MLKNITSIVSTPTWKTLHSRSVLLSNKTIISLQVRNAAKVYQRTKYTGKGKAYYKPPRKLTVQESKQMAEEAEEKREKEEQMLEWEPITPVEKLYKPFESLMVKSMPQAKNVAHRRLLHDMLKVAETEEDMRYCCHIWRLFYMWSHVKFTKETTRLFLQKLVQVGEIESAADVLLNRYYLVSKIKIDVHMVFMVIEGALKNDNLEIAMKLFDGFKTPTRDGLGIPIRKHYYLRMIKLLIENGKIEEALAMYKEMPKHKDEAEDTTRWKDMVKPSYEAILQQCKEANDGEVAEILVNDISAVELEDELVQKAKEILSQLKTNEEEKEPSDENEQVSEEQTAEQ